MQYLAILEFVDYDSMEHHPLGIFQTIKAGLAYIRSETGMRTKYPLDWIENNQWLYHEEGSVNFYPIGEDGLIVGKQYENIESFSLNYYLNDYTP